ncbi:hypothetical protein ACTXT7_001543 [Hymenolepis weldensis]
MAQGRSSNLLSKTTVREFNRPEMIPKINKSAKRSGFAVKMDSDSSVYFSDGCAYPLDKCVPASPSESFSQLVERGFSRNAGFHREHDLSSAAQDNFAHHNHPHPHNVQSSLSQQLTHLSPIRPQRGPVDHQMTSAENAPASECYWRLINMGLGSLVELQVKLMRKVKMNV